MKKLNKLLTWKKIKGQTLFFQFTIPARDLLYNMFITMQNKLLNSSLIIFPY